MNEKKEVINIKKKRMNKLGLEERKKITSVKKRKKEKNGR